MSDRPAEPAASTPEAAAAVAQTRGAGRLGPAPPPDDAGPAVPFEIGAGVRRASQAVPYERLPEDPLYRPLQIYTLDPAASRLEGAVAEVKVPYEVLAPGPRGSVLEVDPHDPAHGCTYAALDLEDPGVLIRNGVSASPADHRFHLQMVYAVASLVYDTFRTALGRVPAWGFEARPGEEEARLRLRPFGGCGERNAWYDRGAGEVVFGYFEAQGRVHGRNLPGGLVFTALSHDVVAHEVTHALLDGLRAHFLVPSRPDVLAFHEAFADLVAYLLHFSYREVVLAAIRDSRGELHKAHLLTRLARQFGQTTGSPRSLRSAIEEWDEETGRPEPAGYEPSHGPHALGNVLVNAVFDAFITLFDRKTRRYRRLASGGTGILAPGDLPADLQEILAEEASDLAGQFLRMIIRAVDYCPPADLSFGELLRAVLTADHDLVPDDPWGYREAWIDAFARRRIYPRKVHSLSERALLWQPPPRPYPVPGLSFGELRFAGDPGRPAGAEELEKQARALGRFVARRDLLPGFGLVEPGKAADPPEVQSIRTLRRIGPDGQVIFDLVAEITQRQVASTPEGRWEIFGGSTVIISPKGTIRYVVLTHGDSEEHRREQARFIHGAGAGYWQEEGGIQRPRADLLRRLHEQVGV